MQPDQPATKRKDMCCGPHQVIILIQLLGKFTWALVGVQA
jgi:hypothetical protein